MRVLKPDPAEYVEVYEDSELRPIDYVACALMEAELYGLTLGQIRAAAEDATSTRDFGRRVRLLGNAAEAA